MRQLIKNGATLIFILFFSYSVFGQSYRYIDENFNTYLRLNEAATVLGIVHGFANDTASVRLRYEKLKKKEAEKQKFLLRAVDYYNTKDFESAIFYINKVKDFDDIDLNNLKYVIKVGSYSNSKDAKNTVDSYYSARKVVDPVNMRIIRKEVVKNISKEDFKIWLNHLMYPIKILDELKYE